MMNLDLVRVTEAGAAAAAAWVGSGNKELADKAATDAMRDRLNRFNDAGTIRIGEGKKDESFGLFLGDKVGAGWSYPNDYGDHTVYPEDTQEYDIAVDPIEGTRPTVTSGPEALSVIGVAGKGAMFCTEEYYMNKLAYGQQIAKKVKLSLHDPIEHIAKLVAAATHKHISKVMICVLDRPRHAEIIERLRKIGVRIKLIQDCDVSAGIAACLEDRGIDVTYGIGGAPESVITACAIKCLKGDFQAQLVDKDGKILDGKVLGLEDLVAGPCAFSATGITSGSLLEGVRFTEQGPVTHSVFMRSASGTVRWLTAYHGN